MIDIAREVARVRSPLLAISAVGWGALAVWPGMHAAGMDPYCSAPGRGAATVSASLSMLLVENPPWALAAEWASMLVAMMAPLIVPEIHHIRFTSLTCRRARSITLFVAGYGGVWMAWGAVLTGVAGLARALMPEPYVLSILIGLVAFIWQASPVKQICLNGCHDSPPLRAFGSEADFDALRFGWTQGVWCAGSCTALMLCAMVLPGSHLVATAAVAAMLFCERLEDPEPPKWKLRGLGKAGRMIVARGRIRWRMLRREATLHPGR